MNTKQVEELTGITRQNIRYYERQGLLEPARDTGNAYRDYSEEDVRRLKLIKMLRMLDMPLKEIEQVLNGTLPLKDAAAKQQEELQRRQKQLQAAVEVCANIQKERSGSIDVDNYLNRMERMEKSGSVFARIVDDYKQVAEEERQRQFTFYAEQPVNTAGMFEKALRKYAREQQQKFQMVKSGMYPVFALDGITYTAVCQMERDEETDKKRQNAAAQSETVHLPHDPQKNMQTARTKIICSRVDDEKVKQEVRGNRRAVFQVIYSVGTNIRRHRVKSILNGMISMMAVVVLTVYMGNLTGARQQFRELPEAIPVRGTVMNAKGDLKSRLFIRQQVLDMVYESSYIGEIWETAELIGHLRSGEENGTEITAQTNQKEQAAIAEQPDEFSILGINNPGSIYEDSENDLVWADGWNWEQFQSGSHVCIAARSFVENQNRNLGESLSCSLERYGPAEIGLGLKREPLNAIELQIVGIVEDTQDGNQAAAEVFLPLESVRQIYEENDKVYAASSLAFTVQDPMELNALKQELRETGLTSVIPSSEGNYAGSALRMDDDVFIQAAAGLEKNVSLLEGFQPFVLLIVLLAGYMVPHLLLQGRRGEYAVMRALGTGKKRCTILFFTEHMVLAMAGGFVGAAVSTLFGAAGFPTAMCVWIIYTVLLYGRGGDRYVDVWKNQYCGCIDMPGLRGKRWRESELKM